MINLLLCSYIVFTICYCAHLHVAMYMLYLAIYFMNIRIIGSIISGLKVGRMTQTIWITWVTFLVGQVGLICKLNCLDVTRISHVL